MSRVALTEKQKRDYKLLDLRAWIAGQMKINYLRQCDVAKELGISQSGFCQRMKTPDKGETLEQFKKRKKLDVFSYGDLLILCELFGVDEKEKERILTI